MRIAPFFAAFLVLSASPAAHAAMFKCVGKDGSVTYQAIPCPDTGEERKMKDVPAGPTGSGPKSPLKEGWTAGDLAAMADACVPGVIGPAKRDFQAAAKKEGSAQEFPEAELTADVKTMCSCFAKRVGETYARADFQENRQLILKKMNDEAIAGGPCKPEGALAEAMAKSRQ
jgi:Domain of unknown function (DUF4124)